MNYQKFARLYSYSRISRYLKASKGNKKKAQQMYYANARLARAFQPLISFFEVVLRNQLHYAIAKHFGDVQWLINQKNGFMSAPSLTHIAGERCYTMTSKPFLGTFFLILYEMCMDDRSATKEAREGFIQSLFHRPIDYQLIYKNIVIGTGSSVVL